MNDSSPNLFNALFQFHPREGHTPKENFLSEAFAYVLTTCDAARDEWLSLAMGRRVQASQWEVITRQSERDDETGEWFFPDMKITGTLNDAGQFDLRSEHKWDSPLKSDQIRCYLKGAGHL